MKLLHFILGINPKTSNSFTTFLTNCSQKNRSSCNNNEIIIHDLPFFREGKRMTYRNKCQKTSDGNVTQAAVLIVTQRKNMRKYMWLQRVIRVCIIWCCKFWFHISFHWYTDLVKNAVKSELYTIFFTSQFHWWKCKNFTGEIFFISLEVCNRL